MEKKSWKQERMEATFEGGQGPEGAVAPYMDGYIYIYTLNTLKREKNLDNMYRPKCLMSKAVLNTKAGIAYEGAHVCVQFDWNLRTMSGPLHVWQFFSRQILSVYME